MAMRIQSLSPITKQLPYYEDMYRIWMESFGPYIKDNYTPRTVTPAVASRYEGDFYGLLDTMLIPKQYHHLITIFNGYRHPGDYNGTNIEVMIPDVSFLDTIRSMYTTAVPLLY